MADANRVQVTPERVATARDHGYSDAEIVDHLAQGDPRFTEALKAGYSPGEILDHVAPGNQRVGGEAGRQLGDAAQSFASHAAQGAIGLAGLPGDILSAANRAGDWLNRNYYVPHGYVTPQQAGLVTHGDMPLPMPPPKPEDFDNPLVPTSRRVLDKFQDATGAKFHEPQTDAGNWSSSVGDFVGLGLIGRARAASRIAQATLAGIASEGAGRATEGTGYEMPARVAAAMVAPKALERTGAARAVVPTAEALRDTGSSGFDAFRNSGLEVKPSSLDQWATANKVALDQRGLDAEMAPKTHSTLDKFANPPQGATVTAANLATARAKLGEIARETVEGRPTSEAAAASSALRNLMGHVENLTPADVAKGDLPSALGIWRDARDNYGAGMRAQAVEDATERAGIKAARTNSGHNVDNTMRQEFSRFLLNHNAGRGFSPEETQQIDRIVRGTLAANALRQVGNTLGGGGGIGHAVVAGVGAGLGNQVDGGPGATVGALALPAIGSAARRAAAAATLRQINQLSAMVRARAPLASVATVSASPSGASPSPMMALRALLALRQAQAPQ